MNMNISIFFTVFAWIFGGLIIFYSLWYARDMRRRLEYLVYSLLTLACATGAFMSDDIVKFLVYWGALLVLLFGMLGLDSFKTAGKAMAMLGIGDFSLMLGMIFLIAFTGKTSLSEISAVPTLSGIGMLSFILIAAGAVAKAGVFGFHNWIVEASETGSPVTMAFLPGCLDKFLGIYLFVRACHHLFKLSPILMVVFMAIGAFTILLAVLLALVQHDFKKLLAYHAVSQVGYMVLGIASGTILGIAGGIFHMFNNTIYKSSLFLNAANLQYRTGTTELSRLGGLARLMPVTFFGTVISSLAIAGVPPLNGFVSKWLIYQGLIPQSVSTVGVFRIIFLIMAMFGSALTLASFIKVIYSAFLSEKTEEMPSEVKEVPVWMNLPVIIFSVLCVVFGIFAGPLVVRPFLEPSLATEVVSQGVWQPSLATGLILLGIASGVVIYFLGKLPVQEKDIFIGGEVLEGNRVQGTEFYLDIRNVNPLTGFYAYTDRGGFDFHRGILRISRAVAYVFYYGVDRLINFLTDGAGKLVFLVSSLFKGTHSGLLDRYVAWILFGFIVILGVLFRCLSYM
ncbi:MAG: hypothetical protein GF409_05710 [Candidatus Omnitrophica bacterium]|nr:hypothetical protein [Candidatus Omnitrophota bacterium]